MDYNIKNITDLDQISSIKISDVFLIGRNSNSYYSTFNTTFDSLSSRIYIDVRNSLSSTYQDISCLNDSLKDEYHRHITDAYVAKQMLNEIDDMKSEIMDRIYPVGSIYITVAKGNPKDLLNWQSSTWEKVCQGRCLMGGKQQDGSDLSTTVDSGLPSFSTTVSITGLQVTGGKHSHNTTIRSASCGCSTWSQSQVKGAHAAKSSDTNYGYTYCHDMDNGSHTHTISSDNVKLIGGDGIYGKSTIVQPPAFFVNIWTRTE